ncbi:hypothetical protein ULO1_15140 [Carboxydocella sp. ULO1]|nr:hypothetical protein ULO1_15140 [Carboxydocella sp. ULO1]
MAMAQDYDIIIISTENTDTYLRQAIRWLLQKIIEMEAGNEGNSLRQGEHRRPGETWVQPPGSD